MEDFPELKGTIVSCPKCGKQMAMFGIEQQGPLRIVYSFECQSCGVLGTHELQRQGD